MKLKYLFAMLLTLSMFSCEIDNFDAPSNQFNGRFTYNGESLQLRGTGGDGDNILYAIQKGSEYENSGTIPLYVNSDGEFNSLMYDGHYQIVLRQDRGPWVPMKDTIEVDIQGAQTLDIEVTPYYMLRNSSISFNNNVITVSTEVDQIVEDAEIDKLTLFVSSTMFVDNVAKIAEYSCSDAQVGINEFSYDISDNAETNNAKFLYARVGLKAKASNDYIFSEVVQLR